MVELLKKIFTPVFSVPVKGQQYKKLKASTLVEVLVASVIIIIVFAIASMTLNTIFKNTIKNDTHAIETHINKLQYLYRHDKIKVPYQEKFKNWHITITQQKENNISYVLTEAVQINENNTESAKKISKKQVAYK